MRAVEIVIQVAASNPSPDYFWTRLRTMPVEGHVTISDLIDADASCRAAGLIEVSAGSVHLTRRLAEVEDGWQRRLSVLAALWSEDPPPWLSASSAEKLLTVVPDADREVLAWTEAEASERDALLLGLGRKVDALRLQAAGALAEEAVVDAYEALLGEDGGGTCERVSLVSDQLGYDVRVTTDHGVVRAEVKGAAGTNVLRLFLSRHEAYAAKRLTGWRLVVCAHRNPVGFGLMGYLLPDQVETCLPSDSESGLGEWESCKLVFPSAVLHPGLPLP